MVSSIMSYICNCQPAGHKKGDFSVALKNYSASAAFCAWKIVSMPPLARASKLSNSS